MQSGPCGEDKAVPCTVDQPDTDKSRDGVERVCGSRVVGRAITNKLIDRPRALIVRVDLGA
jgi:hypothetical protein